MYIRFAKQNYRHKLFVPGKGNLPTQSSLRAAALPQPPIGFPLPIFIKTLRLQALHLKNSFP